MHAVFKSRENASPLTSREKNWRDRYGMLQAHGYHLRQRYKPDWKPSWLFTKTLPPLHEDFNPNCSAITIDAIRIADGRRVFLKRVPTSSSEVEVIRFLLEEGSSQDAANHTVPLLDEFRDDEDPTFTFIVMPLLRRYDMPEFCSVDEVLDFMKQLLEGLVYMHSRKVAHRDCSHPNIMMDADSLFPRGFHPQNLLSDAGGYHYARPRRRRDVGFVRYHYIDFGISSLFNPKDEDPRVLGSLCSDKDVPELSEVRKYNPFYTDIFLVGNVFKQTFFENYENLAFLEPLIDEMTQFTPRHRPTAAKALDMFNDIVSKQSTHALRWRLKPKSAGKAARLIQDVDSIYCLGLFYAKRALCVQPKNEQ